ATNAATVAQKAFNAAMKANPIGLIITAVTILIGLFVLAYEKVDWFRAGVDAAVSFIAGIWTSLVELLGSLWDGLVNTVMQLVGNFRDNFAKAVAAARAIWNGLVSFARGIWRELQRPPWRSCRSSRHMERISQLRTWPVERPSVVPPHL